jgi:putative flippase GtrA
VPSPLIKLILEANRMKKITEHLQRPGVRYLLIGGTVYVLELIIIILAQRSGASDVVAVGISFWIGLSISFALTKFVTFSDKRVHPKILVSQVGLYMLLIGFNFGFTILAVKLLSGTVPPTVSRTVALAITTIWNFYLYKTRIFRPVEATPKGS